MSNPRNFQNQISNKNDLIEFNKFLNLKIIENLFDFNLIPNYIINQDINQIQLNEEENEICNILNKMKKDLEDDYDIIILDEYEKEKENIINKENSNKDEEQDNKIDNHLNKSEFKSKNSIFINANISSGNSTERKNNSYSNEDEKSLTYDSKFSHNEFLENKNKNKYNIISMNNNSLFEILNKISKENNSNIESLNKFNNDIPNTKITNQQIIEKVEEIVEKNGNGIDNLMVKNCYLRKMACIKLYKAFCCLFKNYNIHNNQIQNLCKFIEHNARFKDIDMKSQYKEYIFNILKNISL